MNRVLLSSFFFLLVLSCQMPKDIEISKKRLKKSNYVLQNGIFPERLIQSEIKIHLLKHYGANSFATEGDQLFQKLRRIEFVDTLPQPEIVASCDSYEILSKDKIEDNLFKKSQKWYELRLLKEEFAAGSELNPKAYDMISLCVESEKNFEKKGSYLSGLEQKK